ncbi:ImmA/IrrE family metallo-endopeptidase [Sanguibacter sp. HDW7]|uniref:ImmA/IrrE family metallo-endopeptidase n=1 Tax=Sanguibacter sp. HDW7 TaxID=2714931 RepID=UPI00140BCD50|nr:ImmA/IrrE family metallo-endopeptidase [Sanguibacter sp. HDW7]QIK82438.1 ImmA/IrrE family metallo-endopeptidase [Sanguibacter sp. HDW7]
MTLDELVAHAEEQGLRVVWRDLGRRSGELTRAGLVVVNHRKSTLTQRITIAHEVGHHWHGHDWTRAHDVERDERQADLYAARLLIDPHAMERAAAVVGCHPGAIARELGVTTHLVTLWLEQPQPSTRCGLIA